MVATRRLETLSASLGQRLDLPGHPWVVALSGGADSAALAWLTSRMASIRTVHVHHGLLASDALEQAARAVAEVLKVEIEVRSVTLEKFDENEARNLRYAALRAALGDGDWLLTGHTADDQAETVLANLLRGAGVDGLAGIPSRRENIARPMLAISRSETRELATLAGLPWTDDPTNLEPGPLRNRIRLELIPHLEAEFNPAVRRHLAMAARAISELSPAGPEAGEEFNAGEGFNDGWRVPVGVLWAMGQVGAVRAMRPVVRRLRQGYGLDRDEAERMWNVVLGAARAAELTGGLRVERSGPWLQICRVGSSNGQPPRE